MPLDLNLWNIGGKIPLDKFTLISLSTIMSGSYSKPSIPPIISSSLWQTTDRADINQQLPSSPYLQSFAAAPSEMNFGIYPLSHKSSAYTQEISLGSTYPF